MFFLEAKSFLMSFLIHRCFVFQGIQRIILHIELTFHWPFSSINFTNTYCLSVLFLPSGYFLFPLEKATTPEEKKSYNRVAISRSEAYSQYNCALFFPCVISYSAFTLTWINDFQVSFNHRKQWKLSVCKRHFPS